MQGLRFGTTDDHSSQRFRSSLTSSSGHWDRGTSMFMHSCVGQLNKQQLTIHCINSRSMLFIFSSLSLTRLNFTFILMSSKPIWQNRFHAQLITEYHLDYAAAPCMHGEHVQPRRCAWICESPAHATGVSADCLSPITSACRYWEKVMAAFCQRLHFSFNQLFFSSPLSWSIIQSKALASFNGSIEVGQSAG